MPSPFPGMDPYLEDARLWPGIHNRIIYCLSSELNRALPRNYIANIEERLYVAESERHVIPDLTVVRTSAEPSRARPQRGVALMERVAAPSMMTVWDEDQKETYIQIEEAPGGKVITIVELLSYSNKSAE